jgi:iron complex outermembrane receptor protein
VLTAPDFDHTRSSNLLEALSTGLPGVTLGDQFGNRFQRDLNYRGFIASPVQGTPQGLAVFQNGIRINESFGDVVNWAFIPETAIQRVSLVSNNPVYGLNAVGGALNIEMKNGFTYQDRQAEAIFGSYGRIQGTAQFGAQDAGRSIYLAADSVNDAGWRDFSSSSQLRRMYVDLGARNDQTEYHINFTGADTMLGAVAATPIEMLDRRWSSVYTWSQTSHLQLAFLTASINHSFSETVSWQANSYYRGYRQAHVDGNGTGAQPCDPTGSFPG